MQDEGGYAINCTGHLKLILKSVRLTPGVESRGEKPKQWIPRTLVAKWVATVVQVLPYLLLTMIISVPLVFTTAWDSFFEYYDTAWDAFAGGRIIEGFLSLLQILLLVVSIAAVLLTLVLVGRRVATVVWRWSEGEPAVRAGLLTARFALLSAAAVVASVALFTWLSNDGKPTSDDPLKESLREAGSQVATLLVGVDASAQTEPAKTHSETKLVGISPEATKAEEPRETSTETVSDSQPVERTSAPTPPKQASQQPDETAKGQQSDGPAKSQEQQPDEVTTPSPAAPVPASPAAPDVPPAQMDGAAPPIIGEEPTTVPIAPADTPAPPAQTAAPASDVPPVTALPEVTVENIQPPQTPAKTPGENTQPPKTPPQGNTQPSSSTPPGGAAPSSTNPAPH